ncbi:MAG: VOC family protein [Myxococcaceae bacterium]|nr:VOC family protein [Myxococcaceae bacterium]
MARKKRVSPLPEHFGTVSARLVVHEAAKALDFYKRAFGARELRKRFLGPKGEVIDAAIKIGDTALMVTEDTGDDAPAFSPKSAGGKVTTILATYWPNVDRAWARALKAGAEVVFPLGDQFYGERGGRLRDPFGQQWMMSQRIELVSHAEMVKRAKQLYG